MTTAASFAENPVIRASAGAGKTFALSNRFLGLLFAGAAIDSILATTFTRKAAGEILDRVLLRLAVASLSDEKASLLGKEIGDASVDSVRCRRVLCETVRQIHRLRIGTLDSFFMQIAQSFSLELGLPAGWQIADEAADRSLRARAIRGMLRAESTSDVQRLMNLLAKGDAARSVAEKIAGLVQDLYSCYAESPAEAWHSLPRRKGLAPAELDAARSGLRLAPMPSHKSFVKGHELSCADAESEAWGDFLGKRGLSAKIFTGEAAYYQKPIAPELRAAYEPLIEHAKAVIVGQIVSQTEATHEMLDRFDSVYRDLKLSERSLRFEDVTRTLDDAKTADRLDDILYRLDVSISHLLLDEFQDTSPAQWRVLRPLAKRAESGKPGHSLFCVGDVKQAIYGWRGGVAEIFDALEDDLKNITRKELKKSYRSSQIVIDCVNRVFGGLAQNAAIQKHSAAAKQWSSRFAEHETERKELSGYCTLATAPPAQEADKQWIVTLQFAAERTAEFHRQSPGRTIGVLTRSNRAVARLIYELRQRGVEASEEGGNPLTDSPAVEVVLSLLTLADHPGDTIARFHVANSPPGEVVGLVDHVDSPAACRLSLEIRDSLLNAGYGPTVYGWTKQLAAFCDRRDLSRLLQLVELAYRYEAQATGRADDFVNLVRQQRVQNPTAAKVRVMTVHQAKGLQFDVVVLPELDVQLLGRTPEIVVGRPEPAARIDRVCRYVAKDLQPLLPESFQKMFDAHQQRAVEESLCVLYVAMTRAIHALHMIVAPPKPNEKTRPATWAGLLRDALADEDDVAEHPATLYEHGDAKWFAKDGKDTTGQASGGTRCETEPMAIRLAESPQRATRGLDRRSPSQMEGGSLVNLAQRMRLDAATRLDRGSLLHAWFEQIEWLDEGLPAEAMLRQIARQPEFATVDIDEATQAFRDCLQIPAIREALCRPAGVCRVQRERPFAVRDGDTILSGKIDRLVLIREAGKLVAAEVVDYKTDAVSASNPAAIDARVEIYRPQLQAYRLAVSKLYGLPPEQVSTRLLFLAAGCVRSV